jgi:MtN3 and saliva related transmembrane protein
MINLLGMVAGILTTISFLPQVFKIYKTKSAKDISLEMFILFSVGIFLWLIYGFCIASLPVILSNFVTLILASIILFFKYKYK